MRRTLEHACEIKHDEAEISRLSDKTRPPFAKIATRWLIYIPGVRIYMPVYDWNADGMQELFRWETDYRSNKTKKKRDGNTLTS